jgi:hypothetical protein
MCVDNFSVTVELGCLDEFWSTMTQFSSMISKSAETYVH